MFGLLGLLGAVVAGFFVDALVVQDRGVPEDHPDQEADQAGRPEDTGSLLDEPEDGTAPEAGMPEAGDDLDPGETLQGGAEDDRLAGSDDSQAGGDPPGGGDGVDWPYVGDAAAGVARAGTLQGEVGRDDLAGGASDGQIDVLKDGLGEDALEVSAGDPDSGGGGADAFAVHDIAAGDPLAQITDFNRDEDALVLLYDADHHSDPEVTISTAPGSAHATVLLDGVPVAQVLGGAGLQAEDVVVRAA